MPNYFYEAINDSGNTVSGTMEAESIQIANSILMSRNLIPSKIKEQSKSGDESLLQSLFSSDRVKMTDLIIFTKQLRSMLVAGVPMLRLLDILANQTESHGLKKAILSIIQDIKQGLSFSEALEKFPKIFPVFTVI